METLGRPAAPALPTRPHHDQLRPAARSPRPSTDRGLVPNLTQRHGPTGAAVVACMRVFSTKAPSSPAGSRRWPRRLQLGLVALLVIAIIPAASLTKALTASGTDPIAARAAEWARGHGLGFLITAAEELTYHMNPPKKGGRPDPSLLRPALSQPRTPGDTRALLHASLRTIVSPSLPGEGVFRAVVSGPRVPSVQLAYLRPDPVHTSYLAAIMVICTGHRPDRRASRLRRTRPTPTLEPTRPRRATRPAYLAATFNGGFKLRDAQGGYYADGHTVGTLQPGAASLVITPKRPTERRELGRRGPNDIPSGLHPTKPPHAHRPRSARNGRGSQRTHPLGRHGEERRLRMALRRRSRHSWQRRLRGRPVLSARSLAESLLHAGAVRAMELDINPTWTSAMWASPRNVETSP